ncbi:hypothetical protein EVAR_82382_1 [Eumeta japonica]|uniref:SAM-dependent MTase RsmB/NOP-type domain-containing protein n=1 Tax=Eumeta variegata TaxID=151549 RepID=A0A4C1UAV8_EUMVA|nr:hypothetical protein EVAR_82382_1 [Eumeta japonica]
MASQTVRHDALGRRDIVPGVSHVDATESSEPQGTLVSAVRILTNIPMLVLKLQSKEIGTENLPKFYFIKPDCLVIEKWPSDTFLGKVEKEVIVDTLCGAAVLRGSNVYAPGVMGLSPNTELNELVNVYADIEGKCKKGLKTKFEGEKQLVGTGRLKKLRFELFDQVIKPSGIAVNILMPTSGLPVINENLYPKGDVLLQNLPSLVCGWVVDARPGEIILDMCAAPGNKTTHLAEMSNNKACVIALDKTPQKIAKIKENCYLHGITCVESYVYDAIKCHSEDKTDIAPGPPFSSSSFDKILLDAPCSGLGQRPQLNVKVNIKTLQSYPVVQKKLIATTASANAVVARYSGQWRAAQRAGGT